MKKEALAQWGQSRQKQHCNSLVFFIPLRRLHQNHMSALLLKRKQNEGQLVGVQWHDTHTPFYGKLFIISYVVRINTRKYINTQEHRRQGWYLKLCFPCKLRRISRPQFTWLIQRMAGPSSRAPAEIVCSNSTGDMNGCRECCVLSGRDLCDELITRPDESYRLWRVGVCDLETSKEEAKAR